jgi:hypothetical protein
LLAHYPFNGNASDESGNGNEGTVNGATLTTDRFGNPNSAYNFDGTNDYIGFTADSGPVSGTGDFSLSAYIKTSSADNMRIMQQRDTDIQGQYWLVINDGEPSYGEYRSGYGLRVKSTYKVNDGNWHMITFVRDSQAGKGYIYIDGELNVSDSGTIKNISSALDFAIGKDLKDSGSHFNGDIDDVRVYNCALTANEIRSLYLAAPLAAYYPFNGNADDESDNANSDNANNGTVNGATLTTDRFGNTDSAYSFDGTNDYIDAGTAISLNNSSFTISVWVKTNTCNGDPSIISNKDWDSGVHKGFIIAQKTDSTWKFNLGDGSNRKDLNAIATIKDGNWHHLAVTVDVDGNIIAYQDGAEKSRTSFSGIDSDNMDAGLGIKIAQDGTGSYSKWYEGAIDGVRIYNSVLTASEIRSLSCSLLAYYPFDGNADDESGNINHGAVSGATLTTDRFGNADSAYSFDGSNDYVDCGDSLNLTDAITVAAWVKNDDSSNGHIVNCGGGWSDKGYSMFWYNGNIRIELQNSSKTVCDNSAPSDNEWHHIAFIWEKTSGTITLYIDGVAQSTTGSFTQSIGTPSQNLNIGRNEKHSNYFNGSITEVRIYDGALTANEIKSLYSSLIAYYPFNGNANDESDNGNNGTVNGATLTTGVSEIANSAYEFDGDNDYIRHELSNSWIASEFTVALWASAESVSSNQIYTSIFNSRDGGGNNSFQICLDSDSNYSLYNGTFYEIGNADFFYPEEADSCWQHIAVSYDGSTLKTYIDGEQTNSHSVSLSIEFYDYIIGRNHGGSKYFKGSIDDVRVYDRALSADEIKSLYRPLLAYYPFSGNANDKANANNGTVNGATLTTDRFGNADSAYSFDGNDDYIGFTANNGPISGTGSFTLAALIKTTSDDKGWIMQQRDTDTQGDYWFVMRDDGCVGYGEYRDDYGLSIDSYMTVNDGEWHHIAFVRDASENKGYIYIDGTLSAGALNDGDIKDINSNSDFCIGKDLKDNNDHFNGAIDAVRIYERALSAEDILKLYSEECLIARYSLDGNANDISGNDHHATLNGSPTLTTDRFGDADSAYYFDGVNDYLQLPNLENVRGISMWVNIPDGQSDWRYLLDAREGLSNGWVADGASDGSFGSGWEKMYVNGVGNTCKWDNIPKGEWVNLYFETKEDSFDDQINFMSRYNNTEFLEGTISDIRLYNRSITATQSGSNYGINIYAIGNMNSEKELSVEDSSTATGANLEQDDWNDENSQKWKITSTGDGYYKIESCHSGHVMEVASSSTSEGAYVEQNVWDGGDNQKWKIIPVCETGFKFRAKHSELVLDMENASTTTHANVVQNTWDGGTNQIWEFTLVNSVESSEGDSSGNPCGAAACACDLCGKAACGANAGGLAICGTLACYVAACGADVAYASVCVTAVCGAALAGAEICRADACFAAACGVAACVQAACGGDICGAAGCNADVCGADLCGIAGCTSDACGSEACGVETCGAEACGTDGCGSEACGAETCGSEACAAEACGADACAANACAANACPADACAADACAIDVIPVLPGI